jgi:hypothetical protein
MVHLVVMERLVRLVKAKLVGPEGLPGKDILAVAAVEWAWLAKVVALGKQALVENQIPAEANRRGAEAQSVAPAPAMPRVEEKPGRRHSRLFGGVFVLEFGPTGVVARRSRNGFARTVDFGFGLSAHDLAWRIGHSPTFIVRL